MGEQQRILADSRSMLACAFELFVPSPGVTAGDTIGVTAGDTIGDTAGDTIGDTAGDPSAAPHAASASLLRDGAIGCLRRKQVMRLAQASKISTVQSVCRTFAYCTLVSRCTSVTAYSPLSSSRLSQTAGGGGEARGLQLTAGLPAAATDFAAAFDRTLLEPVCYTGSMYCLSVCSASIATQCT